jgi:hypothetical protein
LVHLLRAVLAQPARPPVFKAERFDRLAGCSWLREGLEKGTAPAALLARMAAESAAFMERRQPYVSYSP